MPLTDMQVARHEAAHGLFSTQHGLRVERVTVRPKGLTTTSTPFTPADLARQYRTMPHNTIVVLQSVCGMILAGPLATDGVIAGQDQSTLQEWGTAWQKARVCTSPAGPTWALITTLARCDVLVWLCQPATKQALGILARELLHEGTVDGSTWETMVRRATGGRSETSAAAVQHRPPFSRASGVDYLPPARDDWRAPQGLGRSLYRGVAL